MWLHGIKHLYYQKKSCCLVAGICLINVAVPSTIFLLLLFFFLWLFPNDVSDNGMLSSNFTIVFQWNRIITFSRVCTIRPYPCVEHCWMRILSDDYAIKLITINLAPQVNFWFDGKAGNCIFLIGEENNGQKLRDSITVQLPSVFTSISVLK